MRKTTKNVTVTKSAQQAAHELTMFETGGVLAQAIKRLGADSKAFHGAETAGNRSLKAVSSPDGFAAVIRHGKTLMEFQGDTFAITQSD